MLGAERIQQAAVDHHVAAETVPDRSFAAGYRDAAARLQPA